MRPTHLVNTDDIVSVDQHVDALFPVYNSKLICGELVSIYVLIHAECHRALVGECCVLGGYCSGPRYGRHTAAQQGGLESGSVIFER